MKKRAVLVLVLLVVVAFIPQPASAASTGVRLHGHRPDRAIEKATMLERVQGNLQIPLTFSLPLRNRQALDALLASLYDPGHPLYGHYLTGKEFTDRFGPTQSAYHALIAYARSIGLSVTATHANRLLLNVTGSAQAVEGAFNLRLHRYRADNGRTFYAPDNDPEVPDQVAPRLAGIIGLDNAALRRPHSSFRQAAEAQAAEAPRESGTGPGGGLTPAEIRAAYNMNGVASTGSGQTLALFELDGYDPADIAFYQQYFGLPSVPLQNVLVDGVSGEAGAGAGEATLDIELQMALAPGASRIIIYQGPNTSAGVIDTYNRIATENAAKQISTSWGISEGLSSAAMIRSEDQIFQQMAAQGQSIFAASGDYGAYDNGATLSVDDPASQPYMVAVGGTTLFVDSGGSYDRESAWNGDNTVQGGAGGGGISSIWGIPSWQAGVATAASATMRNVPDVALNANPSTGYAIYYRGNWWVVGGTSCASPLWAAFTACVNQQRAANGMPALGLANPAIYRLAAASTYGEHFHDVDDGSTNLYYEARSGYDNATGWGSFNGASLLEELAPAPLPADLPLPPTGLTATAGDASITLSWNASAGAASYSIYRSATAGAEGSTPITAGLEATTYRDTVSNGVTCYYRVSAANGVGESFLSDEVSATAGPPPLAITSGPTSKISKTAKNYSAQIAWTTNAAATSVVSYGTSPAKLTKKVSGNTSLTEHSLLLPSLARRTTYYYRVSSTAGSSTVSSEVKTFSTP